VNFHGNFLEFSSNFPPNFPTIFQVFFVGNKITKNLANFYGIFHQIYPIFYAKKLWENLKKKSKDFPRIFRKISPNPTSNKKL
jgi:hypothetical protein